MDSFDNRLPIMPITKRNVMVGLLGVGLLALIAGIVVAALYGTNSSIVNSSPKDAQINVVK
jgi:hypothetical protein